MSSKVGTPRKSPGTGRHRDKAPPPVDAHLPSLSRVTTLSPKDGPKPPDSARKAPDSSRKHLTVATQEEKPIWLTDDTPRRKSTDPISPSGNPPASLLGTASPKSPLAGAPVQFSSDSEIVIKSVSPSASLDNPISLRQILDAARAGPSSVARSMEGLSVGPSPDRRESTPPNSRSGIDAFFASEEEPPQQQQNRGRLAATSPTASSAPQQPAHRSALYALAQAVAPGLGQSGNRKLVHDDSLQLKRSVAVKYSSIRVPKDQVLELRAFMTPETRTFLPNEEYDTFGSARDPTNPNREAHDYEVQASLIVRIAAVADVRVLFNFAKSHGLNVCVLGGATPACSKMSDGAVLCDLRGLNSSQKTACIWYIN
eukprot:TRINITY_DN236_c1_g1_i2.p1 TRINITY_DN236_c1_g1~~TRINITY_DN236_c1_g1_i2.p1  ORF type:complete len:370 (+),score=111.43 TRINITY_DN236_c1_g1_i2:164-1273(+)